MKYKIHPRGLMATMAETDTTQRQLAKVTGLSAPTVSKRVNNPETFTLGEVVKIANYFKRSIDEIFFYPAS